LLVIDIGGGSLEIALGIDEEPDVTESLPLGAGRLTRDRLPGVTEDRTFQIVAGAVVLGEAMRAFDVKSLDVSPWALREGVILRRLDRMS
jgi:exopolyphosphatase/pppGpp-phosphohydrolase